MHCFCSAFQISATTKLIISGNSTRRVKWNRKLGFCRLSGPFLNSLNLMSGNGGFIGLMDAYVVRVYRIATGEIRVRLIDLNEPMASRTAILDISNDQAHEIVENVPVVVRGASATRYFGRTMMINMNESASIWLSNHRANINGFSRTLTHLKNINVRTFRPVFNEFDTIGIIFQVDRVDPYHSIFIIDSEKNILCIKFWPESLHLKNYNAMVNVNKNLRICNLSWRPNQCANEKNIPQAFVTEYTVFEEHVNDSSNENVEYLANCKLELGKRYPRFNNNIATPMKRHQASSNARAKIAKLLHFGGNLAIPNRSNYFQNFITH